MTHLNVRYARQLQWYHLLFFPNVARALSDVRIVLILGIGVKASRAPVFWPQRQSFLTFLIRFNTESLFNWSHYWKLEFWINFCLSKALKIKFWIHYSIVSISFLTNQVLNLLFNLLYLLIRELAKDKVFFILSKPMKIACQKHTCTALALSRI